MKRLLLLLALSSVGLTACTTAPTITPTPTWVAPQMQTQTSMPTATSGWFATVLPITPTVALTATPVVSFTASAAVFLPITLQGNPHP